ncbi:MAG: macro domain-containing protein [Acidobacteria bacterium]|nr:macro domain-containing protein [Acidobacteriota bacterium]
MIREGQGNLLAAHVEALVNTVNCVGYMGKGIALQFKRAYPENFRAYQRAVKESLVQPGTMFVFETGRVLNPKWIVNFPTKRHWRGNSRLEDIQSGLAALVTEIQALGIRSIAVPPLGCGNGGLDWNVVGPMIKSALAPLSGVDVLLFPPAGSPAAESMPVRTASPRMTPARALVVKAMEQYQQLGYRLTLLEIHKLAYFLQEAGEPLRLRYEAGPYGPYADNLNKVLETMEGHVIRGYDGSLRPDTEVDLLPGAGEAAGSVLREHAESRARLDRVADLITGFETPHGMELLSSVHWVAAKREHRARSADEAVAQVHAWNDRKRRMFPPDQIHIAWQRLSDESWIP